MQVMKMQKPPLKCSIANYELGLSSFTYSPTENVNEMHKVLFQCCTHTGVKETSCIGRCLVLRF